MRILGMEVTEKNAPQLRSLVGIVFQDPENQLFMPTVYDDVGFGPLHLGRGKPRWTIRSTGPLRPWTCSVLSSVPPTT